MGTTPTNPVGASMSPPNTVTSPAGSEVTNNPSAAVPPVSEACESFQSTVDPAASTFVAILRADAPENTVPPHRLNSLRRQAIPVLSKMLRDDPSLSGSFTADDIDSDVSDATGCESVASDLTNVTAAATDTANVKWDRAWTLANEVYVVAKERTDGNTVRAVAEVKAILAQGKRADTAPVTAVVAQTVATRLTTRAANARQTATTKTAKANALQDGTGDATIVQPAPSAPATTTAPAATPGTPGSTTIR